MYEAGYRGKNIPKQLYLMRDDRAAYKRRKLRYRINEAYVKGIAVRKLGAADKRIPIYDAANSCGNFARESL